MDTNKKNTFPHPNNSTFTFQKKSPSLSPPQKNHNPSPPPQIISIISDFIKLYMLHKHFIIYCLYEKLKKNSANLK